MALERLLKGFADFRFEWFSEGFTDYFAQKILTDSKLLTPEKRAELVNRSILHPTVYSGIGHQYSCQGHRWTGSQL